MSERKPKMIFSDKDKEFYDVYVNNLLQRNEIKLYPTYNEPKTRIAERFIRTLRGKIESNFILT